MDGCGISWHQSVQFTQTVRDGAAIEAGGKLASIGIDIVDVANVAVVDFLLVVVLDLHDLVAGCKGPTKTLDLTLASRVQRSLQFDVEGTSAHTASVHRAQHLDVADGVQP